MRIGNTPVELEERARATSVAATRPADPAKADVVSLSSRATTSSEPLPQVAAKVAEIRERVRSGEYPIDLQALAERIVDDELLRAGVGR